jgi:muramidase (phage lysozyme)
MAKTASISEAAPLLALIRKTETGHEGAKAYETLYGHNQHKLTKPLTRMTVDEVISAGPGWTRSHVSSAAGAYQFMHATLKDLKNSEGLTGREVFDARLQDRLGFALLNRRGFQGFMAGTVSRTTFGLGLAREWASFPVLAGVKGQKRAVARGETYYAGDGLNKALVKPETVEAALDSLQGAKPTPIPTEPLPDAKPGGINPIGVFAAIIILAAIAAAFFVRF